MYPFEAKMEKMFSSDNLSLCNTHLTYSPFYGVTGDRACFHTSNMSCYLFSARYMAGCTDIIPYGLMDTPAGSGCKVDNTQFCEYRLFFNPLTAGVAYIRFFFFY